MARERLWLGGVDVADFAIRAIDLSGTLSVPDRRGTNLDAEGRNGSVYVPKKRYRGRRAVFNFWLRGSAPDGTVPADPKAQFYDNLHRFAQLLAQPTVAMVHQLPDGTRRRIDVEPIAAITPERYKVGDLARVSVSFDSVAAFWEAEDTTTATFTLTNGQTRVLTEFEPSDAPIDDAVVTFGPVTGLVFSQVESGLFLAYDNPVATGRTLGIDCGAYQLSGTGGLVVDRTKLRTHPEDGRWFALDPVIGGAPTVRMQCAGTDPVDVTVTARQKWLFG